MHRASVFIGLRRCDDCGYNESAKYYEARIAELEVENKRLCRGSIDAECCTVEERPDGGLGHLSLTIASLLLLALIGRAVRS